MKMEEHTKMHGCCKSSNPEAWLWSRTATGLVIHGAEGSYASFCTRFNTQRLKGKDVISYTAI